MEHQLATQAFNDTIVALSTPAGHSGIGVVRVSGPAALPSLKRLFQPLSAHEKFVPRKAIYGTLKYCSSGATIDDGIALFMPGPHSYTGEDTVELTLHGNPVLLDMAVRAFIDLGARLATRGEFTRRAFLAGKLDLVQAEAVIDLIEARTPAAILNHRAALDKSLSTEVQRLSDQLKDILAELEYHIDFDEDDLQEPPNVLPQIDSALHQLDNLIVRGKCAASVAEGFSVVIAGRPNVGKSTLFNRLVRTERMIVTPYPGTTRDPVEEPILLHGMRFNIADTAGIRKNPEPIEEEGIRRTRERMEHADIILLVIDGSMPLTNDDRELLTLCEQHQFALVMNKLDLPQALNPTEQPAGCPLIFLSARTGVGLDKLEEHLRGVVKGFTDGAQRCGVNQRCLLLLEACSVELLSAQAILQNQRRPWADTITMDIRRAFSKLEEITGERVDEKLLDRIFERFCVGK